MNLTCQTNIAGPEENCGSYKAYTPCGKPAVADAVSDREDWCVCEKHARELEDTNVIVHPFDEEPKS